MPDTRSRRPWIRPLVATFIGLVVIGLTASYFMFSEWSAVRDALPPEAEQEFSTAVLESGGGQPYIEITPGGTVVHRDLEGRGPGGFSKLVVLGWSASGQKLVRVEYPRWFVQLKISWGPNLGTMISALRGDLDQLDLSVKYGDLARLGPALLLDHRTANGSRIMLWTE